MPICLKCFVASSLKLEHTEEMGYKERYKAAGRYKDRSLTMKEEAAILTKQFQMKTVQRLGVVDCNTKYSNVAR